MGVTFSLFPYASIRRQTLLFHICFPYNGIQQAKVIIFAEWAQRKIACKNTKTY